MAYVDLNPIRAGIARTPETSQHTSVYARIHRRDHHLLQLQHSHEPGNPLPLSREEYLQLVDWSGRALRAEKRGFIAGTLPPILERLDLGQKNWLADMQHYGSWYYRAVGSVQALERYCQYLGQQWLKGARPARMLTT
jgi:hypothetical protein